MRGVVVSALLLLAAGAATPAAPAPFDRPERPARGDDLARLQGDWTPLTAYRLWDGEWVKVVTVAKVLVIRGESIAWQGSFAPSALVETFTLPQGPRGRAIDFISPREGGVERAAYAIEGDTLTIVLPVERAERPSLERGKYKLVYRRKR
jgi:uncharacterized protein (TIGR03067 family)